MNGSGYFQRLTKLTPTRMWVNNPTLLECDLAIKAGAINCSTNPTYSMKMIQREDRPYIDHIFSEAWQTGEADDHVAESVQMELARNILYQGTTDKLIESDPPIVHRMETPTHTYVIDELLEKLPDFEKPIMNTYCPLMNTWILVQLCCSGIVSSKVGNFFLGGVRRHKEK